MRKSKSKKMAPNKIFVGQENVQSKHTKNLIKWNFILGKMST